MSETFAIRFRTRRKMPTPERIRPRVPEDAPCRNKRRYPCEATARASAAHLFEEETATVDTLYPYHCEVCRGWHLTKNRWLNAGTPPITAQGLYITAGKVR